MRRCRRQRATQCRRDARPSDTASARVESTPPSAKRHQSITPPVATLASASSVPASIAVVMYRENDRRSSRESFLRYRSGVRNISKTLASCIANSEPRQMSKEVGSRRPEGLEPLNHLPGILSCHSSTPLKSYWCDGTLSSSRGYRRTQSHSFQCSLDSKVEGTLTKVLAVSLCFVIDLQKGGEAEQIRTIEFMGYLQVSEDREHEGRRRGGRSSVNFVNFRLSNLERHLRERLE